MRAIYAAAFIFLICSSVFAADRAVISGQGVTDITVSDLFTTSTAYVAGVSVYGKGWPALPGVKSDVDEVSSSLEKAGFEVIKEEDQTKGEFVSGFESFLSKYASDPKSRVLVYFAGHGYTTSENGRKEGYIVLKNAGDPVKNSEAFKNGSIPLEYFSEKAKEIKAAQVLFVFDSCFAGTVFSTMRSVPELVMELLKKPVREFITSGSENQMVPDESVFKRRFRDALQGDADVNGDGVTTGTELGDYLQRAVSAYSAGTQTPVYGKMSGYDGEFILLTKDMTVRQKETAAAQAQAPAPAASGEREELLAVIKKNPGSPEANKALERLREIDPSLSNNPPVEAPERKNFVMTAKSVKITRFSDDSYPYVVIAPLFVPAMHGGFKAAFRIKAKDRDSYIKLNERKDMLKSVMSRRLKESNLQLVDSITEIRERMREAASAASEWVCPGCADSKPSIAGLAGL